MEVDKMADIVADIGVDKVVATWSFFGDLSVIFLDFLVIFFGFLGERFWIFW